MELIRECLANEGDFDACVTEFLDYFHNTF